MPKKFSKKTSVWTSVVKKSSSSGASAGSTKKKRKQQQQKKRFANVASSTSTSKSWSKSKSSSGSDRKITNPKKIKLGTAKKEKEIKYGDKLKKKIFAESLMDFQWYRERQCKVIRQVYEASKAAGHRDCGVFVMAANEHVTMDISLFHPAICTIIRMDKAFEKTVACLETIVKKNLKIFKELFPNKEANVIGILRDGWGIS